MTGSELKEARQNAGITQKQLAELLGYKGHAGESTVQNWEYGKQPIPSKYWRELSKILKVPLEAFVP